MKILTHPSYAADLNVLARVMAAFIAHLDGNARPGGFDPVKSARLLLLSNVDAFEALTTPDGDSLLNELLNQAKRVRVKAKGGAA